MFAIPFERDFTLIGTADQNHNALNLRAAWPEGERDFVDTYFKAPITASWQLVDVAVAVAVAVAKRALHPGAFEKGGTAGVPLPDGDFEGGDASKLIDRLGTERPFLGAAKAERLIRACGTDARRLPDNAVSKADPGRCCCTTPIEAEGIERHGRNGPGRRRTYSGADPGSAYTSMRTVSQNWQIS